MTDNEKWPAPPVDYAKLIEFRDGIEELVYPTDGHDYNTSCDALWKAAKLAFDFVAHELRVTGFQAEMAAIHLYGQLVGIDGPYMILRLEKELYPQYDNIEDLRRWIADEDSREWLRAEARKKIAEYKEGAEFGPTPRVLARWEELARD